MSFQRTPARSSRVTKPRQRSAASALGLRRSTSSPSSSPRSRKTSQSANPPTVEEDYDEPLDDIGAIASLASNLEFRDVPQYIQHIREKMFSPIPEKAGMNSTRIAEVLNNRKNLPPIVTVAHIDALSSSSTRMEREIAELAQAGVVRRVNIPHRGVGAATLGDGLALVSEWQQQVRSHPSLSRELQDKYIALMNANPTSGSVAGDEFTPAELSALTTAGFLTTPTNLSAQSSLFVIPGSSLLSSLSTAGSRHAAGSLGAVGGIEATQHISGTGAGRRATMTYYNFSLPNTGSHVKLLLEARNHLLSLLKKSKWKEAPMDILRERWDGGVPSGDGGMRTKKASGEFTGILPGRTKKWKQFWGMRLEWILEECVGAGLVECFQTRSVGIGVRMI